MMDNPLKQYFRRPALYLKLPSKGNFYPEGAIDLPENGEVPVYPMTAIDEITTKTPDALYNGVAVTDIIKSCVPAIKNPWLMPAVDLDPILVAIRAASGDGNLELESTCPKCSESSSYGVNLSGVLQTYTPGDYDTPLDNICVEQNTGRRCYVDGVNIAANAANAAKKARLANVAKKARRGSPARRGRVRTQ